MPPYQAKITKGIHIKALSENTQIRLCPSGGCPQTLPRFQEGLPGSLEQARLQLFLCGLKLQYQVGFAIRSDF